jgi:high-affinity iron transporter
MLEAFLMVMREGFESFLIVAIILSFLSKTNRKNLIPAVVAGIVVSIGVSTGLGLLLVKGINESLWEGVLGIVTIVMVGSLVYHMWRFAPKLKSHIEGRFETAAAKRSTLFAALGVFALTVVMISREGMETALMLLQVRDKGVISGILLGLAAAAVVSWIWWRYSHLINLKRFFQVTGVFLILFMLQVALYSFHEFSEAGLLPNSERIHEATEPFSPVGIYGQWISILMVSFCVVWLLAAQFGDRLRKKSSTVSTH